MPTVRGLSSLAGMGCHRSEPLRPWEARQEGPLKSESLRVKLPVGEETSRSLTQERWVLPLRQDQVPRLEQWVSESVFFWGTDWKPDGHWAPADEAGPEGLTQTQAGQDWLELVKAGTNRET